jgi:hypothetical protein
MNYLELESMVKGQSEVQRRKANFIYWLRMPKWKLADAALLLFDRDPLIVSKISDHPGAENLLRVMRSHDLLETISPLEAALWFTEHCPEYPLPPDLIALLEEAKPSTESPEDVAVRIADWQLEDIPPADPTDRGLLTLELDEPLEEAPAQEPLITADRSKAARDLRNSQPSQVANDAMYRSLLDAAAELWTKGDQRNHRQMRDFLLSDCQYSKLSRDSVLFKLKKLIKEKLKKPELVYNKATKPS